MKIILLVLTLAININVALAAPSFNPDEFIQEANIVNRLSQQGKHNDAIVSWKSQNLKFGGQRGHYESVLGALYYQAGQFKKAEESYLNGVKLDGSVPKLYIGLATVYLHTHEIEKAREWAQRAINEKPEWWLGYLQLGELERRDDNLSKAHELVKKSLQLKSTPDGYWQLAIINYDLNNPEHVINAMEAAINLNPSYLREQESMSMVAVSLAKTGQFDDAYNTINLLKKSNPSVSDLRIKNLKLEVDRIKSNKTK